MKGHLKQEQQNLRSTRPTPPDIKIEPPDDDLKTHDCFITFSTKEEGTTYSDLTGRYPRQQRPRPVELLNVFNMSYLSKEY